MGALRALRRHFRRHRWTVGLVPWPIDEVIRRRELPEPCWLRGQPAGRFYADPFPLRRQGSQLTLLVEDYQYRRQRGSVAELTVELDGRIVAARPRLDFSHHASYPFLLRRGAELYCLPETCQAGRVAAHRWDEAARAFRHHADLVERPLVDATLFEHEGRWWLFATLPRDEARLYLFWADDWTGPWTPHPANPVKDDLGSARPAGALVSVDGQLYRPAQDCRPHYGAGLAVNRVVELSPRAFREETAFALRPRPGSAWPDGLHSLNGLGDLTLVDGLRFEHPGWLP
jgi:hypothetical protein